MQHAYDRVPYYRRLLDDARVSPGDIGSVADLERIPVTRKADIRDLHPRKITAEAARLDRCRIKSTSGSSGVPLRIYWDRRQDIAFFAACVRSHVALRCRLRDKFLIIGPTYYPEDLFLQRLGVCRLLRVSPFDGASRHVEALNSFRPDVFESYPSVLAALVAHLEESDVEVHRPRLLTSSGEYLDAATRERATRLLGPPHQFYGAWEMGRIGNECAERAGLHLNEDLLIPELLADDAGGSAHRLVLTNLENFTMPFIRYELGDLVEPVPGECACGSTFRRVRMLSARASEVIRLPDRGSVSALHLTALVLELPGVRRFRITQMEDGRVVVLVVPGSEYSVDAAARARARMAGRLPGVTVEWRTVGSIERDPSGKQSRFVDEGR